MRQAGRLFKVIVVGTALGAGMLVKAQDPGQTQWKLANFTWVKRMPAEAGAPPNQQPAVVTQAALAADLGSVRVVLEGEDTALFAQDEIPPLAQAIREALSLAQPGEDLILLSTYRRGKGFMDPALGLTARLFVREGALNLLVHDARLEFMGRFSAEHILPVFRYGSRTEASGLTLHAVGASRLRADWLSFPLAPVVVEKPQAITVPTPAPPRDPAFYEAQAERLRVLKRLRDENLITEIEYQAKREAILKTL